VADNVQQLAKECGTPILGLNIIKKGGSEKHTRDNANKEKVCH
jgi:hypothetical protein